MRVTVKAIFNDPSIGHAREAWFVLGCPSETTKADLLKCLKSQMVDIFIQSKSFGEPSRAALARRIHSLEIFMIEGV